MTDAQRGMTDANPKLFRRGIAFLWVRCINTDGSDSTVLEGENKI